MWRCKINDLFKSFRSRATETNLYDPCPFQQNPLRFNALQLQGNNHSLTMWLNQQNKHMKKTTCDPTS